MLPENTVIAHLSSNSVIAAWQRAVANRETTLGAVDWQLEQAELAEQAERPLHQYQITLEPVTLRATDNEAALDCFIDYMADLGIDDLHAVATVTDVCDTSKGDD